MFLDWYGSSTTAIHAARSMHAYVRRAGSDSDARTGTGSDREGRGRRSTGKEEEEELGVMSGVTVVVVDDPVFVSALMLM